MSAVIMTEKCWANSYFSIAKYYGGVKIDGHEYKIVNKEGVTLEELSNPSSKHYVKSGKAIPPGEPADLEAATFTNAILKGAKLYVTADQAAVVTHILEGIYKSEETGKPYYFD